MSKTGHKSGGGRAISADEAELWKQATRTLEPVKTKQRVGAAREMPAVSPGDTKPRTPAAASASKATAGLSGSRNAATKSRPPAPIADFDRRKARQIASGRIEVAARIDLHGLRQHDARAELRAFLLRSHAAGHRTVLVITGKGGGAEPADGLGALLGERQRGVLKRSVPHWLEEPDLRAIMVSYTDAGPRHGGTGALYVQLRKRDPRD